MPRKAILGPISRFPDVFCLQLSIAGLAAGGVKRRIGCFCRKRRSTREPLDDTVVCVRADDGRGDLRRALAVGPRRAAPQAGGSEASVYRDQLTEIDRDVAAGLIGASEAEAARVEISRRLLAAADRPARSAGAARTRPAPGRPRSSRWWACRSRRSPFTFRSGRRSSAIFRSPRARAPPDANQPLDNLVAQVEAHLEKNPTDGRGWSVLAPVLARLGRYDDAVRAYRNVDHL